MVGKSAAEKQTNSPARDTCEVQIAVLEVRLTEDGEGDTIKLRYFLLGVKGGRSFF